MVETAKAILARGDAVLIFAEGTRIRPGALGRPRRGVGRLALETGAPVVPVAVIGTEAIRKGWRIRPHKVRIRVGAPAHLPDGPGAVAHARRRRHRPHLALRDAAVGVARRPAAAAPRRRHRRRLVGHRGRDHARPRRPRGRPRLPHRRPGRADRAVARQRRVPARRRAAGRVNVMRASELELSRHDLVCFAVPAAALPAAVAAHGGEIPRAHGRARDVQGPRARRSACCRRRSWPSASTRGRSARSAGPSHAAGALSDGASLVVGASDPAFGRQVTDALDRRRLRRRLHARRRRHRARGLRQERRRARRRRRLARRPERRRRRRRQGLRRGRRARAPRGLRSPRRSPGLAGTGDLVATVLADGSRNRRAGELLAQRHAGRGHRRRARPDRRGRRVRADAAQRLRRRRRRRARAARAGRRDRGRASRRRAGPSR